MEFLLGKQAGYETALKSCLRNSGFIQSFFPEPFHDERHQGASQLQLCATHLLKLDLKKPHFLSLDFSNVEHGTLIKMVTLLS